MLQSVRHLGVAGRKFDRKKVSESPRRIFIRDAASYCAILFDDNNRKPVCRLRFNNENRLFVGLFNERKEEERFPIESLDQLFDMDERLKATVLAYLSADGSKPVAATA